MCSLKRQSDCYILQIKRSKLQSDHSNMAHKAMSDTERKQHNQKYVMQLAWINEQITQLKESMNKLPNPKTIHEAITKCADKYYPAGTCPHGHNQQECGKYVIGGSCVECAKVRVKNYRQGIQERRQAAREAEK